MTIDRPTQVSTAIVAAVIGSMALREASNVFEPVALALFIVAIVWPMQQRLQTRMPALLALAVTVAATATICLSVASLAIWGFGRVGRSLIADSARYQALYESAVAWLDDRGISVAGLWAEHFNAGWMLRAARRVTGQLNTTLSFWLITLVYVMLGLLEVDVARRKVEALANRDASRYLIAASAATAQKFRKYMFIRTQMSIVTGLLVWVFAWIAGLQFAAEWGVIAFVLNYIPFIGPFVATLFPTLLAMMQFDSWQAVVGLFIGLNLIQFAVGTYVEPRVSGDALAMSPFLVLFAVFFWAYLWGMFGAFIGDPIAVAILTFCRFSASGRPIADLFGGPPKQAETAGPTPSS